jgi:hypothetical protein
MAMTNAERQKNFRVRQRALKPPREKPEAAPLTNAERQKRYRGKLRDINAEDLAAGLEEKRKEIIRYVETMPTEEIQALYDNTVLQKELYDRFNSMDIPDNLEECSNDFDDLLRNIAPNYGL